MISRLWSSGIAAVALGSAWLAAVPLVKAGDDASDLAKTYARPSRDVNPQVLAADKVWTLGRKLFFDTRLSASSTISCATCHRPDQSWSDHLPKAVGEAHKALSFRTPTLLNAGQIERYGWTGRFSDIAAAAFFAASSPKNMNLPVPQLIARLQTDAATDAEFRAAFPDGAISKHSIGTALTRFVQSISSAATPFDLWIAGDTTAVDASAARGFAIFNGKGRCAACHAGWAFTDGSFHDIGIAGAGDLGRGTLFKTSIKLQYAFKTPTLRNVAVRAPYMHDGSLPTLEAVIDHYDEGGIVRPSRAEAVGPLHLSVGEKTDLVAFLKTLTGGTTFVMPSEN